MRGITVAFMLIMIISITLTSILVVWAVANTTGFFEINEINSIKDQLRDCNDKILETARTGLLNTCSFSVERGQLSGTVEGINYEITTHEKVCDQTPWVLIDPEKNLWQKCDASSNQDVFSLKWNYTDIKFQFEKLGDVEIKGQSGRTIEISRGSMSDTQTNLTLRIY
ncbi:hypothetical protein A3K64_03465 [Candidatus Micrarchaeota archaeon RBG_16_36_9]|nr:MAG: hypothetical protein A3K64_03465 [Candidatus Micrarchaeota archaeon RBG_16_36_9]